MENLLAIKSVYPRAYSAFPSSTPVCPHFQSLSFRSSVRTSVYLSLELTPRFHHLGSHFPRLHNRFTSRFASLSASQQEPDPEKKQAEVGGKKPEEAWKQGVELFKEQAAKMQNVSLEAYDVYSKKAADMLQKTSEQLKSQADKTKTEFSTLAKEVSAEGKEYISLAAENSPDSVKEIVEKYSSSTDDIKEFSQLRDFHVGIPYGFFLSLGGFISFMFTGSTAAIRFGIIIGGALLAASVWSMKCFQAGKLSYVASIGQAALASIIFLREIRLLFQGPSFFTFFTTIISGAATAFFLYKIKVSGGSESAIVDTPPATQN